MQTDEGVAQYLRPDSCNSEPLWIDQAIPALFAGFHLTFSFHFLSSAKKPLFFFSFFSYLFFSFLCFSLLFFSVPSFSIFSFRSFISLYLLLLSLLLLAISFPKYFLSILAIFFQAFSPWAVSASAIIVKHL